MSNLWQRLQSNRDADGTGDGEQPPRARPAPPPPFTFEGVYEIFAEDGRTVIGTESWKLHATAHGISGKSLIQLSAPAPQTRHMRFSLTHGWRWTDLSIRIEGGPQLMLGFDGGKATGHFRGASGLRQIEEPWQPWYEIDYNSPLFNAITIARMGLATGESERLRVYYLDNDTLLPTWMEQIYTRAEHVPSPAFPRQPLIHYILDFGATGETLSHMWVDSQPVLWHFRGAFKLKMAK